LRKSLVSHHQLNQKIDLNNVLTSRMKEENFESTHSNWYKLISFIIIVLAIHSIN